MIEIIDQIKQLNWQSIAGLFVVVWYFTHDIKQSMKDLDKDVRENMKKLDEDVRVQGKRVDQLYQMFIDLLKEGKK